MNSTGIHAGGTLLSIAVALISYRYVAKLGFIPPNVAANPYFHSWIVVHATSAATALLVGPFQFVDVIRRSRPRLHRGIGLTYVLSCLIGGLSALLLSPGVSAGPVAASGFWTLGALWLHSTGRGLMKALTGDFPNHRRWMIRSFALTLAAVTLRLYLPVSQIVGIDFLLAYQVIAWLCWVPNAIFAEAYLRKNKIKVSSMLPRSSKN